MMKMMMRLGRKISLKRYLLVRGIKLLRILMMKRLSKDIRVSKVLKLYEATTIF